MRRFLFFAIMLFAACAPAQAQEQAGDSLLVPPDSAAVRRDSLASPKGIDTLITYTCSDSIVYSMGTKTMTLYNKGDIRYQKMRLRAEQIHVNWDRSSMTANGIPDSSSDSLHKKYRGLPVMNDGGEEFHGYSLGYNFKTKKGRIDLGDTKIDQGFYHGDEIKKVEPDVLFVEDGRYTTCDAPEPHYYFGSPKMKVIMKDKIIAEPVYLYIADVPIFALPFGVFPNKGGRRSGIIAPAIVEDATRGRLLRHLGYYWAMNDYMDLNLRSDLYTKGSWALYSDYRYSLRYLFNGSISGQYHKFITGETTDPGRNIDESYMLNFYHNQEVNPTTRLNVNFTFASNNSYLSTIDQQQLLNQTITSNATLSKSWEGTPYSVTVNASRNQYLQSGNVTEVLPSISFNNSLSYPFRFGKSIEDPSDAEWYQNIGFTYSASMSNNRAKVSKSFDSVRTGGILGTTSEYERDRSQSINQNMSLNIAPKLGFISIAPFLNYSDSRVFGDNDIPNRNPGDTAVTFSNKRPTQRLGYLSTGVSMSTKLYGIVQPGAFGIQAIRHTLTPSLSWTYRKQLVGDDAQPKQMSMALNVGNIFELKTNPKEEGGEGQKIQLLNVNAGIGYNFSVDSLNFSGINVGYRTDIGNILNVSGGANFDLYKLEQTGVQSYNRVNKFLLKEEGRLARLTDYSVDLSTSLSGERKTPSTPQESDSTAPIRPRAGALGLYRQEDPDFSIPWRLGLTFNLSESKTPPFPSRNSAVRGDLEFNLTENWKFSMSGGYDITNRDVVVPRIGISRDLHCWIMDFTWQPLGLTRSYQFEIRLKATQLRDIKVTKQGSERGYYNY